MELKNKYEKGGEFKEDTPKIYVADLKSYNEGKLIGEWVDLTDYNSGEEVQDKIDSLMKEYSEKYHDGEETEPSIHDYENFDSSLYSEYMGKDDYDIIIDTRKISEEKGIPAEVLQSISNDFSPDNLEEFVDDRYIGEYDGDYELGENYVDNVGGIEGVKNSEFYFDYEALGRDLSINDYNEYDGHYFQNYKKGGKVQEYDLYKYAKGGSLDKDLSGNYTSTDDFVSEHGLTDLAKEKFGDDWESGGDYDYDVEEIKLLSGGDYKIIYVDSERHNRENFEEAKQKYLPKIKRKSNDGDIFVVRSMEKGGSTFAEGGEIYKKGDTVLLQDGNTKKTATVVSDGIDSENRVRVRPQGFPFDMSISTIENDRVYIIKKMEKGGEVKKKENKELLIGGLAGILLGIFLGRK